MTRDELLALADCIECLCLFADEGIAMTPESSVSDPQDVLCRLLTVMAGPDANWTDLAKLLRERAEVAQTRQEPRVEAADFLRDYIGSSGITHKGVLHSLFRAEAAMRAKAQENTP